MKLSVRLLLLVLITALPILAIQVYELLDEREQRKAAIAEQALDLARLAAAQQDQFIESARNLLIAASARSGRRASSSARAPAKSRAPASPTAPIFSRPCRTNRWPSAATSLDA